MLNVDRAALLAMGSPLLFVHAHPDDETISTGALIAELSAQDIAVDLCTATRGERGEVVPGSLDNRGGRPRDDENPGLDLERHRAVELAGALVELGVRRHCFLGEPPARAAGLPTRRYRDSGMAWGADGVAGPAADVEPTAFTSANPAEPIADLVALVHTWRPAALISYDDFGTYGHPDHRRCHQITQAAAIATGVPLIQIASHPDPELALELSDQMPTLRRALAHHRTQLTVFDDGIRHVGGQRDPFTLRVQLLRDPT